MEEITLVKVSDLYSENESGEPVLLRKNIRTKFKTHPRNIIGLEEIPNSKGKPLKSKCRIYIREFGPIIIKGNINKIQELINTKEQGNPIGFFKGIKKR